MLKDDLRVAMNGFLAVLTGDEFLLVHKYKHLYCAEVVHLHLVVVVARLADRVTCWTKFIVHVVAGNDEHL